MKSVLLITRDFPPNSPHVGWMIRVAELAKYLSSKNYKVYVLAIKRRKEWHGLIEMDEKIDVCYIKDFFSYWDVPRNQSNFVEFGVQAFNHLIRKLFKNKMIDINHFSWKKYFKKASMLIEKENIKNVFISMPPFSLQKVAVALKQKFGEDINLILDYRDAWTLRKMYIEEICKKELDSRKSLEQKNLLISDLTIFVSSGMFKQYNKSFNLNKSIIIQNGFVEPDKSLVDKKKVEKIKSEINSDNLVLGYFGSGSVNGKGHKDFLNLIKAIERDDELREKITLLVAGWIKGLAKINTDCKIINAAVVNNSTARKLMEEIDIGLVVHSEMLDAPNVMGGKLYDYVAARKPIWFLVPENAVSIKEFISRHNKGYITDIFSEKNIVKDCKKILLDKYNQRLEKNILSKDETKFYSRKKQYSMLLPYLK